ncbi:MAG TPA: 1-acyl-sn-glycerol-3-phosphate acyltransferase [Verrucomicrobiae bacterium]|nr:1-acyl-sn-glycerol-3-phosphate acyltransferase [Verrucomicrobiae bacterium]
MKVLGQELWPEIALDLSNMDEVQAFAERHEPNADFLRFFHRFWGVAADPTVVYGEGAREAIPAHLASGDPTAFVMTHFSLADAPNAASGIHHEEPLQDIEGRTVTQASADWFRIPGLNWVFARGGAWPVVRTKDVRSFYVRQGELTEDEIEAKLAELNEQRKDSNSGLRRVESGMVDRGLILTTYIEGTRNRGDPTVVQPVKNAIKNMLESIQNPEAAKIICMAYDYGGARILPRRYLTPTLFFDIMDAPADPEDVNELLQEFLQGCATAAIANRRGGAPLSTLGKLAGVGAALGGAVVADRLMSRRA